MELTVLKQHKETFAESQCKPETLVLEATETQPIITMSLSSAL